jgi:dUTP pyrophosphatase
MKIILTHPNSRIPERKTLGAACFDCYSTKYEVIRPGETVLIPLGFAIELPDFTEMQIRGRSSMSKRGILTHVGTVDSDYRGEVSAILTNLTPHPYEISVGDRVAQACISNICLANLTVVPELSPSIRGANGFGSTGV